MGETIVIRGARQHNLDDIDLEIPRRSVIAVTGVSGSGKSSLAFDTIFAEGQRRYIESLSTYARQFIEKLERPDVDEIAGISPTIAIRQKNTVTSARSTVGTATEIYDYLRLLFARVGRTVCPDCGLAVRGWSPSEAAGAVIDRFGGRRVHLVAPAGTVDGETWESRRHYFVSRGYARLLAAGEPVRVDEFMPETGTEEVEIGVLIDRVTVSPDSRSRIADAAEIAYREPAGILVVVTVDDGETARFTSLPSCTSCGRIFVEPSPLLFSFNSPFGACPECKGFGDRMDFSEELIVPDQGLCIRDLAVDPWSRDRFSRYRYRLFDFCDERGIPLDVPWRELDPEHRRLVLEGAGDYVGVIPFLEKMREKSYKKGHRFFTRRYMDFTTCRACRGGRLRPEASWVRIDGRTITELAAMTPERILDALEAAPLSEREQTISRDILAELEARLRFMIDVGLGYLTLDRLTRTLSGGEAQRINLANSLGANLVDALYVLDEPSVGLHAADNERLVAVMRRLRDLGNTVIVVEHDPDIVRSSDWLVDLGPGPGRNGGRVLFNGSMTAVGKAREPRSATLTWLFGGGGADRVARRRVEPSGRILLRTVTEHNLRGIDVEIPLGCLTCVTGVSGSGKSSLVVDVLHRNLAGRRGPLHGLAGIEVEGRVDRILLVDQSPIGSTPRSNPITYIKGFSHIRAAFAAQRKAQARGYPQGRFSFNKPGGRCSRCQGMGYRRVEMHFMADVFVPCDECGGKRFNHETLEVLYKGKDISEVLELTVDEAIRFFDDTPLLGEKLWILSRVGLGYLALGQPSNTLSGGEAQRIKIARELAESSGQRNLYIMDEPTTGLHMADVERLMRVLGDLVDAGHGVVVIEHNLEVIGRADHVIDLGPGGGDEGGRVIACGTPDEIVQCGESLTGKHLAAYRRRYMEEKG